MADSDRSEWAVDRRAREQHAIANGMKTSSSALSADLAKYKQQQRDYSTQEFEGSQSQAQLLAVSPSSRDFNKTYDSLATTGSQFQLPASVMDIRSRDLARSPTGASSKPIMEMDEKEASGDSDVEDARASSSRSNLRPSSSQRLSRTRPTPPTDLSEQKEAGAGDRSSTRKVRR